MKLTPRGRTALWIGVGGFVGLAVGALLTNPGRAIQLSPVWLVALAVFAGLVVGLARAPRADAPRAASPKPKPAARPVAVQTGGADALVVRYTLPDVPPGYPAVLGRGEPVHVRIMVFHAQKPAEGAGVQLSASMDGETLTADGITGSEGAVDFTLEPEGTGDLTLLAEASADARAGRAETSVTLVNYEEEIERLFGEFRAFAVGILGPDAHADTARELCDRLRPVSDPKTARSLLELARIYELVAYGERTADRRLYLAVLEQLMVLEHAEMPATGSSLAREA